MWRHCPKHLCGSGGRHLRLLATITTPSLLRSCFVATRKLNGTHVQVTVMGQGPGQGLVTGLVLGLVTGLELGLVTGLMTGLVLMTGLNKKEMMTTMTLVGWMTTTASAKLTTTFVNSHGIAKTSRQARFDKPVRCGCQLITEASC